MPKRLFILFPLYKHAIGTSAHILFYSEVWKTSLQPVSGRARIRSHIFSDSIFTEGLSRDDIEVDAKQKET